MCVQSGLIDLDPGGEGGGQDPRGDRDSNSQHLGRDRTGARLRGYVRVCTCGRVDMPRPPSAHPGLPWGRGRAAHDRPHPGCCGLGGLSFGVTDSKALHPSPARLWAAWVRAVARGQACGTHEPPSPGELIAARAGAACGLVVALPSRGHPQHPRWVLVAMAQAPGGGTGAGGLLPGSCGSLSANSVRSPRPARAARERALPTGQTGTLRPRGVQRPEGPGLKQTPPHCLPAPHGTSRGRAAGHSVTARQ